MTNINKFLLNDYLELPYNKIIQKVNDASGSYFYGKILELDGCQSTANSLDELLLSLDDAMLGFIESKLDGGFDVPLPFSYNNFDGKFTLTLPKSLHKKLSCEASNDGVSLDKYILYKLST